MIFDIEVDLYSIPCGLVYLDKNEDIGLHKISKNT